MAGGHWVSSRTIAAWMWVSRVQRKVCLYSEMCQRYFMAMSMTAGDLFFGILTRTVFYWMRLCTLSNWKVCYLIRGSSSTSSSNGNCSHTCRSLVVVVVNERIRDVFIFVIGLRLLLERMLSALRIHQLQLLLNPNPSKVRQRDADWIYLNKTYKGILRLL